MIHIRLARAFQAGFFLCVAASLLACGDATAPQEAFSVAIIVDEASGARVETDPSGGQLITCDLNLSAHATGSGTATWEDATALFYFGSDRTSRIQSIFVPRDDARQLWGDEAISARAAQRTAVQVSGNGPFSTAIEFRYRVNGGDVKSASVAFDCGRTSR